MLAIHGRRDQDPGTSCETDPGDGCNDVWIQIDGKGHGTQTWTKKMIKPNWGEWKWDNQWDPANGSPFETKIELSAGNHILQISGRSDLTIIDAVRIWWEGTDAPTPPS